MNKIKNIKIKNEDGSISEQSYPISVDAKNVDMTNGYDVQEVIGDIDVNEDGSIAEQLKNYKDYDSDIEDLYSNIEYLAGADEELEDEMLDLLNTKINKNDIIDNLESTATNKVLSANQGKMLDNKIKQKIYFFNTIADMRTANLKEGECVCTLGYNYINDGWIGKYKIKQNSTEGEYEEALANGLYAYYIGDDSIYVSFLKNVFNNDLALLQYCLSGRYKNIYIDTDLSINASVDLPSDINIISSSTITANGSRIFNISNQKNINITGGIYKTLDPSATSANSHQPIIISNSYNINITDCEIQTEASDGLYIGIGYSETVSTYHTHDIKVENCKFINCARNGIVINSGDNIVINNCYFENIQTYSPGHAIDIEFEYYSTHNWLYVNNLIIENCYAKLCRTLCNVFNTEKMSNNSTISIHDCTCDDINMVFHGTSGYGCIVDINNILFINTDNSYSFRIADWGAPNLLNINNIAFDEYIGNAPSASNFEYGDFFIDSTGGEGITSGNIFINNINYLSENTRNQTIRLKGVTDINLTVQNSKIYTVYNALMGFKIKLINCIGVINSATRGYNGYFRILELPDNIKLNFSIYSTSWINFTIVTSDNPILTVIKEGTTYITKARIVTENNKKYLELFTAREYSFPFYYNLKDIPNGIDKRLSTVTQDNVLVEVDVTTQT